MMKRLLLAGTVMAGMTAAGQGADLSVAPTFTPPPAAVHSNISGYVDIYFGLGTVTWFDGSGSYDDDLGIVGGVGRANLWFSDSVALQVDVIGEYAIHDFDFGEEHAYSSFGVGGHLAWRDPNRFAVGIMGSLGKDNGQEQSAFGIIALEGQYHYNNFTFYGQVGIGGSFAGHRSNDDYDADIWYIAGEARYFPMPNLMIAGHLAYDNLELECGGGCDGEGWRWGAQVEYQPQNYPVAGFLRYQGSSFETCGSCGYDFPEHVVLLGGKFMLGRDSLQDINMYGSTFRDYNPVYGDHTYRTWGIVTD